MLDYTARNATVLGKKVNFKWRYYTCEIVQLVHYLLFFMHRVFLTKVRVSECDGELHICVQKDVRHNHYNFHANSSCHIGFRYL